MERPTRTGSSLAGARIRGRWPPPAPAPDGEPFEANLDDDVLGHALDVFSEACDHRFERLEREIQFLRGQVAALLAITGAANKAISVDDDRVVDLPRGFIRRRSDAA